MPAPIIKVDAISKSFGTFKVLDGLSMQVMPREKLALIGPSGSGKTTILRILMTLEKIDGGHIQIDGEQLYHMERNGQLLPADDGSQGRAALVVVTHAAPDAALSATVESLAKLDVVESVVSVMRVEGD